MKKINSIIKKLALACLVMFAGVSMNAQNRIELNAGAKGIKIEESSFKGFQSTFSFNAIESETVKTEAGDFSTLTINKTISSGEVGAPSLPVARELVAVPFGATPVVNVVNFTTTDYKLSDYGIERVYPQQPSYSKDTKVEDMVFQYNENAYQTRALGTAPEITFEVLGTMRGIQLGALQVEPVSYNPATNTLRVYNDIELEVVFDNADVALTEQTLVDTYSPYFDVIYKQLFNSRAIADVYEDHPDLYKTPVHMLAIVNPMFKDVIEPWVEWKTQKGFYLDVKYTDEIGSSASQIMSAIKSHYEENATTFVVIFGDQAQVAPSKNIGEASGKVTDLYYASYDGDSYPEVYHSRMCCETVEEMEALIHKTLQYEKYTMPDPSYLSNVLLIAGADDYWNPLVGQPTIQYASNYYFNEEHGYQNVYKYLNSYSGCYNNLNTGVGFVNYTAHGGETDWSNPTFSVTQAYALTNTDKYFWAMGNCCLAANWGYASQSLGEAMIRAEEKAAWGYVGACPVTYWWEDYYFGVGATTVTGRMPLYDETTMGNYDALFLEDTYNTIASVPFSGNLAVAYAHTTNGYQTASGASIKYYFEAYHTLGDGSVMPYKAQPTANDVTHLPTLPIGVDEYTVTAAPGSYVGISKDGVLHGATMIDESGSADVQITPVTTGGDVTIVVTHPKHIPYIKTIPAAALEGAYLSVASYTPNQMPINQNVAFTVVVENVGTEKSENATMTINCEEDFVTITDATASFNALDPEAQATLTNEFKLKITEPVANGTKFSVNYVITDGDQSWEGKWNVKVLAPVVEFEEFLWSGAYQPGETYTVAAKFINNGAYKAENVKVTATSTSSYVTISEPEFTVGTMDIDGIGVATFNVTIDASSPETEKHEINFALTADNGIEAEGVGVIKNTCEVHFILSDTYGDGWDASTLKLIFDDGTPDQEITLSGGYTETHKLQISSGAHVVVYFNANTYWDYECSYKIIYADGTLIYDSNGEPNPGVNCEFDVECASGTAEELNPVQNLEAEVNMNQVTLTWDAAAGAENYLVTRNGIQIADTEETTLVDSEVENGTHSYNVVAVYPQGESLPVTIVVVVGESVEENNVMFAIYPNPAKDFVKINSNAAKYEYQLINNIGQIVVSGAASGESQIDVANINKGVYFLKVVADGEVVINKLLIQ